MAKSNLVRTCPMWILSPADFLVRIYRPLEEGTELQATVPACGQNFTELSMKAGPGISSLKTALSCASQGWSISYMTLPKAGMMHNGNVYQLVNLATGTKESGYSSLPTPQKSDLNGRLYCSEVLMKYLKRGGQNKLIYQCRYNGLTGTQTVHFYEWMAGFPKDWTKIELKQLEIPYFPK